MVKKGHTVHVPPQSRIGDLAGAVMTIPGTGDITVDTASTLVVDGVGTGGGLAIPSDDVDSRATPAADWTIGYPVRIEVAVGAKVTVAGVADVTLPAGTRSRATYRAEAELGTERTLQVPAGSNVMFGNLRMILGAAVLTMFGIGAEIGIAGVLAYALSEASQPWRWGMLGVTGLVGLLPLPTRSPRYEPSPTRGPGPRSAPRPAPPSPSDRVILALARRRRLAKSSVGRPRVSRVRSGSGF